MTNEEQDAVERELARETQFLQRPELMKRLYRLVRRRPDGIPATVRFDSPCSDSQEPGSSAD